MSYDKPRRSHKRKEADMGKKLVAIVLGIVLVLSTPLLALSGCGTPAMARVDLATIDFAVRLFQQSVSSEENTLISPLSVLCALVMTANGADGNTLAQMENVFGFSISELNECLYSYIQTISSDDECKFHLANSIWFRNSDLFTVEKDFLQTNADYYGAGIYKALFDDDTLKAINDWVSDNTDGMIKDILDGIDPLDVMYLINALTFDATWQDIYGSNQVRNSVFTAQSGAKRDVEMMYSDEQTYLDDGNATGFIKYYAGGRYAFAALLPNEGMTISEYISTLTGQGLANTLRNAQNIKVSAALPKFKSEYSLEMKDVLVGMGMRDAFDRDLANFAKLGSSPMGECYMKSVVHKTFISVDAHGTKAGAATLVKMVARGIDTEKYKTVYLNRPFVYMLIACETTLPFFIGTVLDLAGTLS
jgi:serpin B